MDHDDTHRIVDAVKSSLSAKRKLGIQGHGSKSFLVGPRANEVINTTNHTGIMSYRKDELVITVRSGTSLLEVEQELRRNRQFLAAEPPRFDGKGTIGGAISAGLSGPGRPWYGNLRDVLLGIELVNGLGQRMTFGGQVIKNVAGFDVSRMLAGSWGQFGVILSASFRLHPLPIETQTYTKSVDHDTLFAIHKRILRQPSNITATYYQDEQLYIRCSRLSRQMLGEILGGNEGIEEHPSTVWEAIKDHQMTAFRPRQNLWEIQFDRGVDAYSRFDKVDCVEWCGARAWLHGEEAPTVKNEGKFHARAFHHALRQTGNSEPYKERLRSAFDPESIFTLESSR